MSGEDRFDHLARVDAVLVKAYCIALHQDPSRITTILYRGDADWPALASGGSVSIPLFRRSAPIFPADDLPGWASSQFAPLPR